MVPAQCAHVPVMFHGWTSLWHNLTRNSSKVQVKLWEVYGNRKLIRTYIGHKVPVKDIYFNNAGTEFLSAAYDNYIKLWDTETGGICWIKMKMEYR